MRIHPVGLRSPFLSPKSVHFVAQVRKKDEVRRLTRDSASDNEKKNDTAYTSAEFVQSFEGEQGSYEVEGQGWSARERTFIARTKQYLEESYSVKVKVEELGGLLGPEDAHVDFRRIARKKQETKEGAIFLRLSVRMV